MVRVTLMGAIVALAFASPAMAQSDTCRVQADAAIQAYKAKEPLLAAIHSYAASICDQAKGGALSSADLRKQECIYNEAVATMNLILSREDIVLFDGSRCLRQG